MEALVMDDGVQKSIKKVIAYAEKHLVIMDDLLDTYNKQATPVGDNENFVVNIPLGYKVVYSIEKQVPGNVRHISITYNGHLPSVKSTKLILSLFGFENELTDCYDVWMEDIGGGRQAINAVEIIKGTSIDNVKAEH